MKSMSVVFLWALIAAVAVAGSAGAAEFNLRETLAEIEQEVDAGALDDETALLVKFRVLFDPDSVPESFLVAGPEAEEPFCATPLILEAAQRWNELSDESRDEISDYVSIPDLFAEPDADASAEEDAESAKATTSPHAIDTPNSYQTAHFNIHWGDSGGVVQANVERLGVHLEDSWSVEVEELGYPEPSYTDDYLMDIYIANTGDGVPNIGWQGAYTTVYGESPYMAYIVVHPDIITYGGASEEIASHEFFHTIQFGLAIANHFQCYTIDNDDMWMWEATAVWAEDAVYPNNNSYIAFLNVYVDEPEESLHSQIDDYYPYSRVLFFKYMEEYQGGVDNVYEIWTACDPRGTLHAIDEYLQGRDSSLREGFIDFMNRNARMDYADGGMYDDVTILATHSSYPVTVTEIDADDRPRYLGANFIEFEPDGSLNETLTIQFNGDDSANGDSVTWGLGLVLVMLDGSYESGRISVNDNNEAEVEIPNFGNDYRKVYMIPSVIEWDNSANKTRGIDYKYQAMLETSSDDDDSGDDDDDDNSGDDDDDDEGCGC